MNRTMELTGGSGGRIRTERVAGSIRQEIAEMILRQEIHDPRLAGLLTITDVQLSADLQHATVFFSLLGGEAAGSEVTASEAKAAVEERMQSCQRVLTHAAGFIRSQLSKRLSLRHTPQLRFEPDTSLDYGMRMDRLLHSLQIPPEGAAGEDGEEKKGEQEQ
ncbi:30S ribosome-binding factor RbfA [Candidatus Magnetaquicoccus inordinatus]|uniref:30S ribosome-binding factor RbfA n=1 Tax=Candidatus Magnetaquicoccus inordinatus TaxID=2496818 RepID=UPI00102C0BCA|nr:30S ribosome-binding factor RbfA [Candidatus Magnetaquicoccus inordinatus]